MRFATKKIFKLKNNFPSSCEKSKLSFSAQIKIKKKTKNLQGWKNSLALTEKIPLRDEEQAMCIKCRSTG